MKNILYKAFFSIKETDPVNVLRAKLLLGIYYLIVVSDIVLIFLYYGSRTVRDMTNQNANFLIVSSMFASVISIMLVRSGRTKLAGIFFSIAFISILTLDDPENITKTASGVVYLLPIAIIGTSNGPRAILFVTTLCEAIVISLGFIYGFAENTFDILFIVAIIAIIFAFLSRSMDEALAGMREKIQLEFELQGERFKSITAQQAASIIGSIAHDVRGPIKTSKELLAMYEDIDNDNEKQEIIQAVSITLDEIYQTVTEQLNETRAQQNTVDEFYIIEVIKEAINKYINHIRIMLEVKADINPLLKMNKRIIDRASQNIIINSIEANCSKITITLHDDKNNIIIEYKDNGPGYPLSIINNGPTEGFTTKRDGIGIGLSGIVNNLASQDISVQFTNGSSGGAITTISIPKRRRRVL